MPDTGEVGGGGGGQEADRSPQRSSLLDTGHHLATDGGCRVVCKEVGNGVVTICHV